MRRITKGLPFADEKNPAMAYTLSLLMWGGGQQYSGQRVKGVLFRVFMLVLMALIAISFLYRGELPTLLQMYDISHAEAFLSAELLFFFILIFWTCNAGNAYHTAVKARKVPFPGMQSRIWPLLGSLLVPGWGQFLNGQPLKGSIFTGFSVLGIFSLVSVPAVLRYWPSLETSQARSIVEAIFAVSALYAPLIPVIWLLSGYDALIVSFNDAKKESIVDRILLGVTRLRMDGWFSSIWPRFKAVIAFTLLAAVISFVLNRYNPVTYYGAHLAGVQLWLHQQGMTLVPDLISELLAGPESLGN